MTKAKLAKLASEQDIGSLEGSGYIFEPKLDGIRAICEISKKGMVCYTRNNNPIELDFDIQVKCASCTLDGEVVSYDSSGNPSFQKLQQGGKKKYIIFDIIEKDGKSLKSKRLSKRKDILSSTIEEDDNVQVIFYTGNGKKLWQEIKKKDAEGIIAKRPGSAYNSKRDSDWLKIKTHKTVDAAIIGKGERRRSFSLGLYDADKKDFIHIGNVGTGFDERNVDELHSLIDSGEKPVAEIKYSELTKDKKLRAPVFLRLRDDKKAQECVFEQLRITDIGQSDSQLHKYKEKRDFSKTAEPEAKKTKKTKEASSKEKDNNPIFVIQKHDASKLHYDFRLEHEGVLKSWAIPKNLSKSTTDKRLAIQTEDHPYEYKDFEGTIPKGEYGAGTVKIWDKGRYVNITAKKGKIKPLNKAIEDGHFLIWIKGDKLEGGYAFTRLKDNEWLSVKMRDEKQKDYAKEIRADGRAISITNPKKDLNAGIKKGDLISYYNKVARLMLPHIKERAISMYRFPDGIDSGFYQKSMPDYFPRWFSSITLQHKEKKVTYPVVKDKASIIYLANQVCVPHIMNWSTKNKDKPDKIVFDLDPSKKDLDTLKKTASDLKKFLESIGLNAFLMTTGRKGYHIVSSIKPELSVKEVKDFAADVADTFAKSDKQKMTTEIRKEKRQGKILIDINRNSPNQTSVAPYSARAKPGFPIAMPIGWKDLDSADPASFTIFDEIKKDAWKDFFKKQVSLKKVLDKLKQ